MKRMRKVLLRLVVLVVVLGAVGWTLVTQPLFLGGGSPTAHVTPPVNPALLRDHVQTLVARYYPRDIEHPANLDAVARYISDRLHEAGGRVEDQVFLVDGTAYRNVIARFGPLTRERVVIGAHYDVFGVNPGADDNASGVAGLIELAGLLGRKEWPLTIELVAYTLEEPPKFRTADMGSAHHARYLKRNGVDVRLMISLEMIGYFDDRSGSQSYPVSLLKLFYPRRGDFIAVVGKLDQGGVTRRVKGAMSAASPLPVRSLSAPASLPGVDFSDHLNYWHEGYDAVMVTDTAFYRNPHYHKASDAWDTLDYERMAMVVRGVYAAVRDLAR